MVVYLNEYYGDFTDLGDCQWGCNQCGEIFETPYGQPRFCSCQEHWEQGVQVIDLFDGRQVVNGIIREPITQDELDLMDIKTAEKDAIRWEQITYDIEHLLK